MSEKNRRNLKATLVLALVLALALAGSSLAVLGRSKKKSKVPKNQTTSSVISRTDESKSGGADFGGAAFDGTASGDTVSGGAEITVDERGVYTSKEEVALYIHTYRRLPSNYITKRKAEELGWSASLGNLWEVAPGKSIGGSRFGNYEGLLPDARGRNYYECDIDFDGGFRGAKRIVYSDDGLIYYTEDHYRTFEQLY